MPNVYDLLVLTIPQAASEGKEQPTDVVEKLLSKQKAKVLSSEVWGEKFLAFPVKKYDRGVYAMYSIELTAKQLTQFDAKLKLEPTVLRHLVVKKN